MRKAPTVVVSRRSCNIFSAFADDKLPHLVDEGKPAAAPWLPLEYFDSDSKIDSIFRLGPPRSCTEQTAVEKAGSLLFLLNYDADLIGDSNGRILELDDRLSYHAASIEITEVVSNAFATAVQVDSLELNSNRV